MAPTDPDDDARLVARCRAGDASAWAALVQRYQRLLYAVALRAGLDEHAAADVFQTVFSRLLEHLPKLTQPDRLQAWVVTTAKREALRVRRLGQRTVSMTPEDDSADDLSETLPDGSPLAEDALSDLQQLNLLRIGLDRLDPRCQSLLLLLFGDEEDRLSYDEIAARLGMPAGSIGPTRARCLGKLRVLVTTGVTMGGPGA